MKPHHQDVIAAILAGVAIAAALAYPLIQSMKGF